MGGRYVCNLNVRTFPLKLGIVAAVLVIVHITAMTLYWGEILDRYGYHLHWSQVSILDLDTEPAFGTWFSAVLLLLVGRLLLHHWRWLKREGDRWAPWWLVLAIGFHFLSIDEVAGMHEWLNTAMHDTVWTSVAAPIVGLVVLAYLPWLCKQPAFFQLSTMIGAAIYIGGAVGIERWTDWYAEHNLLDTTDYYLWIALEEGMEMLGPIIFLRGLLALMAGGFKGKVALGLEPQDWPQDA